MNDDIRISKGCSCRDISLDNTSPLYCDSLRVGTSQHMSRIIFCLVSIFPSNETELIYRIKNQKIVGNGFKANPVIHTRLQGQRIANECINVNIDEVKDIIITTLTPDGMYGVVSSISEFNNISSTGGVTCNVCKSFNVASDIAE